MILEEVLAREAIRHTISIYNTAADIGKYDKLVDVFHPQAVMMIHAGPTIEGRDAIIAALKQGAAKRCAFDAGNFQRHHLTTNMIELTGDSKATSTTYIIVTTELGFDHTGQYVDELVREGDRWWVKKRHAALEWGRPDSRFVNWLGQPSPLASHHRSRPD
jgi:hypothetical protein